MKVKVGHSYSYYPCMQDTCFPCQGNDLIAGMVVKVINKHGCPPANTMGNCYVTKDEGQTFCMVSTNSLKEE